MFIEKMEWPDGKAYAAMISVNLDAEYFGKIYYPDVNVKEGDILRLGQTSIRFGLPRLLYTLRSYGVKATFFIPWQVAKDYPDAVKAVVKEGHEIGCHGNCHELLAPMTKADQLRVLKEATYGLEAFAGKPVEGFRMPEGEINEDTYQVLKALGYTYSSSLSDDDVPYLRENSGIMELPVHWELFDLPYFTFTFDPPIPPGQARAASMDDVLANWYYELEGARRWGTLFNLQLDPQATGEQGRIFMLEQLLDTMKETDDVWIATGSQIAQYCRTKGGYHA